VKVSHLYPRSGITYQTERTIAVTVDMENLERSIRNLVIPSELVLEQTSSRGLVATTDDDDGHRATSEDEDPRDHDADLGGHMRRLRKTIITHFSRDKVYNLKLFISKPVLRKIEDGQPLEYLSEMRQVHSWTTD